MGCRLACVLPDMPVGAGVKLDIGGSVHNPDGPVGRLLFNVLAVIAEFASDLIKVRTWEGMKVAEAKGRLRGKRPKLKPAQEARLVELWHAGTHTGTELFSVACPTVCRAVQRAGTTWGPPSVSGRIFAAKPGATPNSGATVTARCAALPD
jgi:hypothetical protein